MVEYYLKSRNRGIKSLFDSIHPEEHQKRIDKLREFSSDDHDNFLYLLYAIWVIIALAVMLLLFTPFLELNKKEMEEKKK